MNTEKTMMCVECRTQFSEADVEGACACPKCGTQGLPASLTQKHALTFTDHEWRILFMWADNFARKMVAEDNGNMMLVRVMAALRTEARIQCPDLPALTLQEDVELMAKALGTTVTMLDEQGAATAIGGETTKH